MRFYADGHTRERIISEMGVSEDEFEWIKSRAKSEFFRQAAAF